MITDADRALFADQKTTLTDIKAAGWERYYSSGGGWWFDRATGHVPDHFFLPPWVHELERQAERRGVSETRGQILHALGLDHDGPGKTVKIRKDADRVH